MAEIGGGDAAAARAFVERTFHFFLDSKMKMKKMKTQFQQLDDCSMTRFSEMQKCLNPLWKVFVDDEIPRADFG
jgi:hypothetical protein